MPNVGHFLICNIFSSSCVQYFTKSFDPIKDGLEEFCRLPQEDFNTCDSIVGWELFTVSEPLSSGLGPLQFPGRFISPYLNVLADSPVLFILGSAAAVERTFPAANQIARLVNSGCTLPTSALTALLNAKTGAPIANFPATVVCLEYPSIDR
jgi:hypothetical protein